MQQAVRKLRPVAILAAMLGSLAGARAATPPSFSERVDVHLVDLEVLATDGEGRPVTDLTAGDFRVLEDDRPVTLQSFAWIHGRQGRSGEPEAPSGQESAAAVPPVRVVVVLDEEHTKAVNRAALFARLGEALGDHLPRGSQVMIWRYDRGMQVLLPFTDDRRKLLATLDKIAATISARSINVDEDWLSTLSALNEDARGDLGKGFCLFGADIARNYAEQKRSEVRRTLGALGQLVGTLGGLPGRKLLLYVGDGVPLRPGAEAWDAYIELCTGQGAAAGVANAKAVDNMDPSDRIERPDPEKLKLESLTYDTSREWTGLAARANGQGVSVSSLITSAPGALTSAIQADWSRPSELVLGAAEANQLDAVFLMARETGGRLVYDGADVGRDLAGMAEDLGAYYLLAYPAPGPGSSRIRQLRVEVARPGVRLRYRRSYALRSDDQQASERLLTRLYYDVGENPLGLRLTSKPPGPKDPPKMVRVQIAVPLQGLMLVPGTGTGAGSAAGAEPRQLQGMITVYVVSRDAAGSATPVRRRALPLRFPVARGDEGEGVRQQAYVYEVAMQLPRGSNDIAVAVRDELTGEISFAGEKVSVAR